MSAQKQGTWMGLAHRNSAFEAAHTAGIRARGRLKLMLSHHCGAYLTCIVWKEVQGSLKKYSSNRLTTGGHMKYFDLCSYLVLQRYAY